MGQERTYYDRGFKENAVKFSYERKNVRELARKFGIPSLLIYRWRKEFQKQNQGSFPGNGILERTPEEK